MKKLGITLLAAAFCLPLTFAATQQDQTAPAAQTETGKKAPKAKKAKAPKAPKKHHKKGEATPTEQAPVAK